MSDVVFMADYLNRGAQLTEADRVDLTGRGISWLAGVVLDNMDTNLTRVANVVGREAIEPIVANKAETRVYFDNEDPQPFGKIEIKKRDGLVQLMVSNNLVNLFASRLREPRKAEEAGKFTATFAIGALVAGSTGLLEFSKSTSNELWDRVDVSLDPFKRECLRFAGGLMREVFCFDFSGTKIPKRGKITPQQAGLINPLSLAEMYRTVA